MMLSDPILTQLLRVESGEALGREIRGVFNVVLSDPRLEAGFKPAMRAAHFYCHEDDTPQLKPGDVLSIQGSEWVIDKIEPDFTGGVTIFFSGKVLKK
jgi:hypothetical protein